MLSPRDMSAEQPEAEPTDVAPVAPQPRPTGELTEAEQVARLMLDDPKMAKLLTGETVGELVESARFVKPTLESARRERQPREAPETDSDGGVRQPAPMPSDAVRDHDQLVVDIALGREPGQRRR